MATNLKINGERLWDSLMEMAKIGATEKGGVCRLALTDLDRERLCHPAVGGIIKAIHVVDTQYVHSGDVLVEIDDTDAKLALAQAEADLALAKRRVHSYLANDEGLSAQVKAREAAAQEG